VPPNTFTIAEDDPDFRFFLERMVSRSFPGAGVASFSNAEGALQHILEAGTDILLTDHAMGVMTGTDLIRELRQRGFTTPIIMISGSPHSEEESLAAGVSEFLSKDLAMDEIREHVRKWLPG
jgi:CheY-like chemotaxis protein